MRDTGVGHIDAEASTDGRPSTGDEDDSPTAAPAGGLSARLGRLTRAVRDGDEAAVVDTIARWSRSRRGLAPLALVIGGFAMLFTGLRLLFINWRLTLVQILPAMWIWLAMLDLKLHVLHGRSFHELRGPVLIPIVLAIAAITAVSFVLNAAFGFAIVAPRLPQLRLGFARARDHLGVILAWGIAVGLPLGLATTVVPRWGRPWFAVSLSVVIGVMMVAYVAVPARLIGAGPASSRRDRLTASAVGGSVGAVVCTPPYLLGRVGILMLGSHILLIPGIIVLTFAVILQAGATGAVKAVKMSARLLAGDRQLPPVK